MGKRIELPVMTTVSAWETPQYEKQLIDVDCIKEIQPEYETGKTRILTKDGQTKYVNATPEQVEAKYRKALEEEGLL